tara:strand:+ start:48162 stop:48506 length:345 start_codon:yes stop_codon:yes gene_type:complete
MDSLKIVRLWAAAAWADGSMHPSEAAALRRLIEASETLSVNDRELALTYLETAPDVDVSEVQSLPAEAREGVYRAARGIVMLDRELADSEAEFLVQLRASLQLSEATIAKVDAE